MERDTLRCVASGVFEPRRQQDLDDGVAVMDGRWTLILVP